MERFHSLCPALLTAGLFAVVSVPLADRGTVPVLVIAGVAGGGSHPFPQTTTDAAVLLVFVHVAFPLRDAGTITKTVIASVAGDRGQAFTVTTALKRN